MDAYICSGIRTPFGRYGGVLSSLRPDDMAALVIDSVVKQNRLSGAEIDEVILGCANQAGEDNRNVARMSLLLAGLPNSVPGFTVNRLCASGLEAVITAARTIKSGEADLIIAGGVESMSRAPLVIGKAETPFSRKAEIYDTTIGWRFINHKLEKLYGVDSMPETGENVAEEFNINRKDQDNFALRSQQRTQAAIESGYYQDELLEVTLPRKKQDPLVINADEHPRITSLEKLAALPTPFRDGGTVTAGNASGVNDGACALLVASEKAVKQYQLTPLTKVIASVSVGVLPRIMGIAPVEAIKKLLERTQLSLDAVDIIELNEAFASQSLAVLRALSIPDDSPKVNPHGGAIALGHPLGASGARIALTLSRNLVRQNLRYGIATLCVGVGQGCAMLMEKV